VNPEIRQKGRRTRKVKTIPARKEGVSPVSRKSPESRSRRATKRTGIVEKIR